MLDPPVFHDIPLETLLLFKYIVRLLTAKYDYWLAVIEKLLKARNIWYYLAWILNREGAVTIMSGNVLCHLRKINFTVQIL